jgi:uncharacterized surface protein with fasciclin (FAS1) repeats
MAQVVAASNPAVPEFLATQTNITVFAFTNAGAERLNAYLATVGLSLDVIIQNQQLLDPIVAYHVAPGTISQEDFKQGTNTLITLQGKNLTVTRAINSITVFDGYERPAIIVMADIIAKNGIIHIINNVLLPPNILG